jgi:hypothetical protein
MAIEKDLLDQLLAGRDPKDVFNKDGLVDELKKALSERILNAEIDEHLDGEGVEGKNNHRNGYSKKSVLTGTSKMTLSVPRDWPHTVQDAFPPSDEYAASCIRFIRGFAVQDSRPGGPWTALDRRGAAELRDARQRLEDAYRDYDEADANAWRNPPNGPCLQCDASGEFGRDIPVGAYPLSAGEGSRCTINGQDGRLVRKGNWLVCEPVRRDAMPVQDARAEAYRLYDEEMANAWRNPR